MKVTNGVHVTITLFDHWQTCVIRFTLQLLLLSSQRELQEESGKRENRWRMLKVMAKFC